MRKVLIGAGVLMAVGAVSGCRAHPVEDIDAQAVQAGEPSAPLGDWIPLCPPGPVTNYLTADMQQCWQEAAHGRWRTLSHELHYDVLVAEVSADSLADAEEIARRFIEVHGERFAEILLYVQQESAARPSQIRRVRWSGGPGLEALEFVGTLPG
jgi:hypothetical protein